MDRIELELLRDEALEDGLLNAERLADFTLAELEQICNGIGPEFFPDALRDFVDTLNPTLRAAAMVHDLDYYLGAGTWEDFTAANDRLSVNGMISANERYKFYDPRRYIVQRTAKRFAALCQACGWKAYLAAIEQRKKDGER